MEQALREAGRGQRMGEVPVGAILVDADGTVIGRGHNLVIARHDPTAHAEVVVIRRAGRRVRNYRLPGTTLYVTLEPCVLCLGAITHARIRRVVYATDDPKRGALKAARMKGVAKLLHHSFRVTGGVLASEAAEMMKAFFASKRLAPAPRR